MKIYLLRVTDERNVFYAEAFKKNADELREAQLEAQTGAGLRGWLTRKYADLQNALATSESGVGLRMRRTWEWLHRRTSPDETLMRSLRTAHEIELYHPTTVSAGEAKESWSQYLQQRRRFFLLWLVVNALIAPLTLLIAMFPGPNIIGYWFCYRAVCHALALSGIKRARQIETAARAEDNLNFHLSDAGRERIEHAERELGLSELSSYVERIAEKKSAKDDRKLAVS